METSIQLLRRPREGGDDAGVGAKCFQCSFSGTSAMPLARRPSATSPFTDFDRMVEAAATAALAAAARTSASAWASASAILLSAALVRRATKSSILGLASG